MLSLQQTLTTFFFLFEDLFLVFRAFVLEMAYRPIQFLLGDRLSWTKMPYWLPRETGTILITGATQVNEHQARLFAQLGYHVILGAADEELGRRTEAAIKEETGNPNIEFHQLDFTSLDSVREFGQGILDRNLTLHVLINGVSAVSWQRHATGDGLEETLQQNYLGPFVLTTMLLSSIKQATPAGRIINESSFLHLLGQVRLDDLQNKRHYFPLLAYFNSKLALLIYTKELQRRLEQEGRGDIKVVSSYSNILEDAFVKFAPPRLQRLAGWVAKSPGAAARSSVYLSLAPRDSLVGGRLYGHCLPSLESRFAHDQKLAGRLWEETERVLSSAQ